MMVSQPYNQIKTELKVWSNYMTHYLGWLLHFANMQDVVHISGVVNLLGRIWAQVAMETFLKEK